ARIVVLPDPSVQLVALRAVWRGGLLDETPEDNGISNLIAGLFSRGTSARRGDEIADEIESYAGGLGGVSGRNSVGLRAELLSRHLDRGLDVFCDCLFDPVFPDEEIEREKRQMLEEIRSQEDNVSSVAFRLFGETLWTRHPYRLDLLGTPE